MAKGLVIYSVASPDFFYIGLTHLIQQRKQLNIQEQVGGVCVVTTFADCTVRSYTTIVHNTKGSSLLLMNDRHLSNEVLRSTGLILSYILPSFLPGYAHNTRTLTHETPRLIGSSAL